MHQWATATAIATRSLQKLWQIFDFNLLKELLGKRRRAGEQEREVREGLWKRSRQIRFSAFLGQSQTEKEREKVREGCREIDGGGGGWHVLRDKHLRLMLRKQ